MSLIYFIQSSGHWDSFVFIVKFSSSTTRSEHIFTNKQATFKLAIIRLSFIWVRNWELKEKLFWSRVQILIFLVIQTSWNNHTPLTRLSFLRFVFLWTINVSLFLIVLILYWTYSSSCSSFSVFGFPDTNWTFQPHLPCFFFKSVRSIWVLYKFSA